MDPLYVIQWIRSDGKASGTGYHPQELWQWQAQFVDPTIQPMVPFIDPKYGSQCRLIPMHSVMDD